MTLEPSLYGQCARCGGPLRVGHDCNSGVVEEAHRKPNGIGAPACFVLELCCQQLADAFGEYGVYQVGSSLNGNQWRDVDLRYILPDDAFAKLFPQAGDHWEQDPRWLILTASISGWLKTQTGLPVDFQFQPQTHANERHKKPRNAYGIRIRQEGSHGG